MKKYPTHLSYLAATVLAAYSMASSAAAPTSGAYITDKTNQYVADQTSQVLDNLNSILCNIDQLKLDEMANKGPYIAMVSSCQQATTSSEYQGEEYSKMIAEATQSSGGALTASLWDDGQYQSLVARLSANEGISATLPYGDFRVDWCESQPGTSACDFGKGYISAGSAGLSYFQNYSFGSGAGLFSYTSQVAVQRNSAVDIGSGVVLMSQTSGGVAQSAVNILFAYNLDAFARGDGTGLNVKCFDRTLANADKAAWSYGMYDDVTGARYEPNVGFPIEYVDGTNTQYYGYIGYWGLWTDAPTPPVSGQTLTKVTYNANGAQRTDYTLMQTGGKLIKHTLTDTPLLDLDGVDFQFYAPTTLTTDFWVWDAVNNTGTIVALPQPATRALVGGKNYVIHWDATAQNFVANAERDMNWNLVPLANNISISNDEMRASAPWGLWISTNTKSYQISGDKLVSLTNATTARGENQDVVYPDPNVASFVLKCVQNCPTKADIDAAALGTQASPYAAASTTSGWWGNPAAGTINYTFNTTTGNLVDAAGLDVVNTNNNVWVYGGKMLDAAGIAQVQAANPNAGTAIVPPDNVNTFYATGGWLGSDFDAATTWYAWQTSPNTWDQLSILKDGAGAPVTFEPPLEVTFAAPADSATYGNYAGVKIPLTFYGFGNLWGIPWTCTDDVTNTACDFTIPSNSSNWHWRPSFSIPFSDLGFVTGKPASSATVKTFWTKPRDEEVRFAALATCPADLQLPATTPPVPTATGFVNPVSAAGPAPVVTDAPRVIGGVVKY